MWLLHDGITFFFGICYNLVTVHLTPKRNILTVYLIEKLSNYCLFQMVVYEDETNPIQYLVLGKVKCNISIFNM